MATPAQRRQELPRLREMLAALLGSADDPAFLTMLWALNALQTGREQEGKCFLNGYPPEAATKGILGKHAIYPWELETLANELLTTPKRIHCTFDGRDWNAIGTLVNRLRALESAEYGARRTELSILVEVGRIGARQFPWQRGYFGIPQLYRSAYIYGQGECAAYLRQASNLTTEEMTLVGFALLAVFYPEPAIRPATDLELIHEWGISRDALARTLERIAQPLATVRAEALELRDADDATAYKPSILRRYPCLLVGHRSRTMMAPLPDLVMDRVTNGLFYDVIGGGGPIRQEVGRRFESYAINLLRGMLPATTFEPETRYRTSLGPIDTPDILMLGPDGNVRLAIECKASRMSVGARFGEAPGEDRGYDEIAKGVMQLWRFHAHARTSVAPAKLADDAKLLILSLDEWFVGRSTIVPQIMARANELADASAHAIPACDRRPIAFCTISELEVVLRTATPVSLLDTVETGSGDRAGWLFSSLHQESIAAKTEPKDYPFKDALCDLLPWYRQLEDLRDDDEGDL